MDGWVCRDDEDCRWIDLNLGCDNRDFRIGNINVRTTLTLIFINKHLGIVILLDLPYSQSFVVKLCHLGCMAMEKGAEREMRM